MTAATAVSFHKGFSKAQRHSKPSPAEQLAHPPSCIPKLISICAMKNKGIEQTDKSSSEIYSSNKKQVFKCFAQFRLELANPRGSRRLWGSLQSL